VQLRCIRAFGTARPGDVADAADGAFDPEHWELVAAPPPVPPAAKPAVPAAAPAAAVTPKAGA
jgi:hypothetical protein